ncbi:MAG: chorismate synthase [Candidatus Omnitrophota bacterium]|nr:MAG: chorismate synthase [Candidatus Omnitrophota bacterium]
MRILTAGESHGEYNVAIVEGFPKGVKVDKAFIDQELKRRMSGYGRGKRMGIEKDEVKIVSGMRNKVTLGSPIALLVKNKDVRIFSQKKDVLAALAVPRPAHADLAAALKYGETDIRNILERASARETVARVAAGAMCKQFLSAFGIKFASFTLSIGKTTLADLPKDISEIIRKTKNSRLNCTDKEVEKLMIKEIQDAQHQKDSVGGVVEVWIDGVPAGLGSVMHYDRRLDASLAGAIMSIPAVKGVEIGLGFHYAFRHGSKSHDAIFYNSHKGFYRKTNNSGGIEGGVSNGSPIVFRLAMKPIATLRKPLESVNLRTKRKTPASVERSDICAIVAMAVIAENMAAIQIMNAFLEKFGCDSLKEIKTNYCNYL